VNVAESEYGLDVGDDGSAEWGRTGVMTAPEHVRDLRETLQRYVEEHRGSAVNGKVEVPLALRSMQAGSLTVSGIVIELDVLSDPLDPDTDGDGIEDGAEVLLPYGHAVLETEDAVRLKEWANPWGDAVFADSPENPFRVETPMFIYQTGVALTASQNLAVTGCVLRNRDPQNPMMACVQTATTGIENRDSWIQLRFHADRAATYLFSTVPSGVSRIFDTVWVKPPEGAPVPVQMEVGSVAHSGIDVYGTGTLEAYLQAVIANITYIRIEEDGGTAVPPIAGTVQELPTIVKAALLTGTDGDDRNVAGVLAAWQYEGSYNLSEGTDYTVTVGMDLALLPAELDPVQAALLGEDSLVPTDVGFDDIAFARLVDFDRMRIDRPGLDPGHDQGRAGHFCGHDAPGAVVRKSRDGGRRGRDALRPAQRAGTARSRGAKVPQIPIHRRERRRIDLPAGRAPGRRCDQPGGSLWRQRIPVGKFRERDLGKRLPPADIGERSFGEIVRGDPEIARG